MKKEEIKTVTTLINISRDLLSQCLEKDKKLLQEKTINRIEKQLRLDKEV